jgi:hypothetical protein
VLSHVINIAVNAFLSALPQPDKFRSQNIADPELKTAWQNCDKPYAEILKKDIIGRISNQVKHIRSSGRRREAFEQAVHDSPSLRVLQLLRPVITRWSSTFWMIDRYLYLSPAVDLFLTRPNPTPLTRDDILSTPELEVLKDIREVFSFFHGVQETLAGEKTPTLPFALPLYEDLLDALKDLCSLYPNLMHAIDSSIQKLEKYLAEYRATYLYTIAMSTFHLLIVAMTHTFP